MAALVADRNTPSRDTKQISRPVAAGAKIYNGAIVCLNAAGFAVPASTALNLKAQGRANMFVDNTGGVDGATRVPVTRGTAIQYDNSANADLIAQVDIGNSCYLVDDHTVAKTTGGGTRSLAGIIEDVDANGVWVVFP